MTMASNQIDIVNLAVESAGKNQREILYDVRIGREKKELEKKNYSAHRCYSNTPHAETGEKNIRNKSRAYVRLLECRQTEGILKQIDKSK